MKSKLIDLPIHKYSKSSIPFHVFVFPSVGWRSKISDSIWYETAFTLEFLFNLKLILWQPIKSVFFLSDERGKIKTKILQFPGPWLLVC